MDAHYSKPETDRLVRLATMGPELWMRDEAASQATGPAARLSFVQRASSVVASPPQTDGTSKCTAAKLQHATMKAAHINGEDEMSDGSVEIVAVHEQEGMCDLQRCDEMECIEIGDSDDETRGTVVQSAKLKGAPTEQDELERLTHRPRIQKMGICRPEMRDSRHEWCAQEDEALMRFLRRKKKKSSHWDRVEEHMTQLGFRRHWRACMQRARKLKEEWERREGVGTFPSLPPAYRAKSVYAHRSWSVEEEETLLMCLAKREFTRRKVKLEEVEGWMKERGYARTVSACQQRISKLMKDAERDGESWTDRLRRYVEVIMEVAEDGGSCDGDGDGVIAEKGNKGPSGQTEVRMEEEVVVQTGHGNNTYGNEDGEAVGEGIDETSKRREMEVMEEEVGRAEGSESRTANKKIEETNTPKETAIVEEKVVGGEDGKSKGREENNEVMEGMNEQSNEEGTAAIMEGVVGAEGSKDKEKSHDPLGEKILDDNGRTEAARGEQDVTRADDSSSKSKDDGCPRVVEMGMERASGQTVEVAAGGEVERVEERTEKMEERHGKSMGDGNEKDIEAKDGEGEFKNKKNMELRLQVAQKLDEGRRESVTSQARDVEMNVEEKREPGREKIDTSKGGEAKSSGGRTDAGKEEGMIEHEDAEADNDGKKKVIEKGAAARQRRRTRRAVEIERQMCELSSKNGGEVGEILSASMCTGGAEGEGAMEEDEVRSTKIWERTGNQRKTRRDRRSKADEGIGGGKWTRDEDKQMLRLLGMKRRGGISWEKLVEKHAEGGYQRTVRGCVERTKKFRWDAENRGESWEELLERVQRELDEEEKEKEKEKERERRRMSADVYELRGQRVVVKRERRGGNLWSSGEDEMLGRMVNRMKKGGWGWKEIGKWMKDEGGYVRSGKACQLRWKKLEKDGKVKADTDKVMEEMKGDVGFYDSLSESDGESLGQVEIRGQLGEICVDASDLTLL